MQKSSLYDLFFFIFCCYAWCHPFKFKTAFILYTCDWKSAPLFDITWVWRFKRKLTEVLWETYKRFWNYMLVRWRKSLYTANKGYLYIGDIGRGPKNWLDAGPKNTCSTHNSQTGGFTEAWLLMPTWICWGFFGTSMEVVKLLPPSSQFRGSYSMALTIPLITSSVYLLAVQFALLYLAGGTSTDYTNPKGAPDLHS